MLCFFEILFWKFLPTQKKVSLNVSKDTAMEILKYQYYAELNWKFVAVWMVNGRLLLGKV